MKQKTKDKGEVSNVPSGCVSFFFFYLFYFFLACSLMMLHTRALVRAVRSAPFRSLSSKKKKTSWRFSRCRSGVDNSLADIPQMSPVVHLNNLLTPEFNYTLRERKMWNLLLLFRYFYVDDRRKWLDLYPFLKKQIGCGFPKNVRVISDC